MHTLAGDYGQYKSGETKAIAVFDNTQHISETLQNNLNLQPNVWYNVKRGFANGIATFYVNDNLIQEYNFGAIYPYTIGNYRVYFQTWGQRDIDDVRVTQGSAIDLPPTINLVSPVDNTVYNQFYPNLPV